MNMHQPTLAEQCASLRAAAQADAQRGWLRSSLHVLIMACLARIFGRLEQLLLLWQSGALPPPQPASRRASHRVPIVDRTGTHATRVPGALDSDDWSHLADAPLASRHGASTRAQSQCHHAQARQSHARQPQSAVHPRRRAQSNACAPSRPARHSPAINTPASSCRDPRLGHAPAQSPNFQKRLFVTSQTCVQNDTK